MHATSLDAPSHATISLSSLFTGVPSSRHDAAAGELRRWAVDYLSRSHPELGRKGAICPFTLPSIKKDLFSVAFLDGADLSREEIAGALTEVIRQFQSSAPLDAKDESLKSAILVFPDFADHALIDDIQLEFKNLFIKYDLMIGQFYPGCTESGLWNAEFRPLDAPYAMIAIRHMTPSDYPFLTGDEKWAAAYLSKFAPDIPARVRGDLAQRIVNGKAA
ncbi:DUF6875 domain-containing protein [Antrihabitans sp. YC2-6]|uniref:DUF6875 domain-containing protein n=1 Tax=Antrihabitans sp. YC2-6 TaxID=2799498 RepID=UPI0018F5CED6|nr:hypothetical protein [Antrihabitans sp. YC2-6]MBJ8343110.1 hypothetical protein [Antrihabitans sp. YC2-6]